MSASTELEAVGLNMLIVSIILSGLTVLEYAWNVRFEIRVIWPQLWKSAEAKIFMIVRYVGLAGQIFNVWFVNRMASGVPNHLLACRAWYLYQVVTVQCLLMSEELLLTQRICKMYNNNKYIFSILLVFVGAQCAAMAVSALILVPGISSSPTCVIVDSHPAQIYAGATTTAVHLCLLVMILWRYFRGNWPEFLRSYIKNMVRDSVCTLIAVSGGFFLITIAPTVDQPLMTQNLFFLVMLFSLWFGTGRLVLGKARFLQESENDSQLTKVDLDNLEPLEDCDISSAKPSDSKAIPTKLTIAVDSELGVGAEEDIADVCICDWVDSASVSSYAPTIMSMETGGSGEGSGSRN
ncbi:hypothetical protein K503DRAFT_867100 [Rhizopogon vinicolor AM-OR11-026]|uniref:Transmembrane protein n=1 Tax=Rhizopogon vinicolor AM-OR11-026 TaxID=1314800 RepID=A0A1B7MWY3_9AGAM|nr:hypothetical protein K503DRAFT_867100 [Rhizopogon vinicolor AM-OR11-026]